MKKIKPGNSDATLNVILSIYLLLIAVIILYPLIFVVSNSFSSGSAVSAGKVLLWPVDFTLNGYEVVFSYKTLWTSFGNTLFYTVVGTALNLILTVLCAYPLSRRNFQGKNIYMIIFMIPMFFYGGLIPSYILMSNLHLTNTRWAVILASGLSIYNMIIMRTFFQNSIPNELLEAAKVDGISDIGYLFRILLPLSKPILAVITLYYAVGHWNSYFDALMYLRNRDLYPLQLVLKEILSAASVDVSLINDPEIITKMKGLADVMKYALIVISTAPILVAFPFVEKFFKQGVMIGSVKG